VVDLGVEAAQKSTSEKSGAMRLTIINPLKRVDDKSISL